MATVESKDVVLATLGASSAIAGLILIFCGFLFAQAASFPPETSDSLTGRFRIVGKIGVVPFVCSMLVTGASFCWLLKPSAALYNGNAILFAASLLLTVIYGATTIAWLL